MVPCLDLPKIFMDSKLFHDSSTPGDSGTGLNEFLFNKLFFLFASSYEFRLLLVEFVF